MWLFPGSWTDLCNSTQDFADVVYESPESSDSDESMHKNVENVTPPPTPPQADSPGPTAALGRLSLDRGAPDNRGQAQRGRGYGPAVQPTTSKRAASSELPRRQKPTSPQQPATNAKQHGSRDAKGPSRQRQSPAPRHGTSRNNPQTRGPPGAFGKPNGGHEPKVMQPVARDSGYETMPSKQNTLQQPMVTPVAPHVSLSLDQQLGPLAEEPKGVVKRLAGPVPVLIDSRYPKLIMQPESSPISQDQLAAEVKGIYGGLVMVEAKCINIDAAQAADPNSTLGPEQWQALIALHRTLLYEHHDFLMATQHPSATLALSGLAQKYSMPARMWRHGIHAFLEVLRHRRPQSQDYMLSFIYLAYQMMALLFETVPAFTDTWIECLGDLARYRMAVEEEKEAHSIWGGVAARWYNTASDRHPQIGRLYHHLGILERPSLRKVFLYAKSLTSEIPFPNARDSLGTLCNPIAQSQQTNQSGIAPAEVTVVNYFAHLFSGADRAVSSQLSSEILSQLSHQPSSKIRDVGVPLLVTNIALLFELASSTNRLWACFGQAVSASIHASRPSAAAFPALSKGGESHADAWPLTGTFTDTSVYDFCYSCFQHIMHRGKDRQSLKDILPSVHTTLVWLHSVLTVQTQCSPLDDTISSLFRRFDWGELCQFLNTLIRYEPISVRTYHRAEAGTFPGVDEKQDTRPMPLSEDFYIRGLMWCHAYFPADWFVSQAEDDGRFFETPAMHKARVERVQWLALFLASRVDMFDFNWSEQRFSQTVSNLHIDTPKFESLLKSEESGSGYEQAEGRKEAITTNSRSSSTLSAHSDSEGYTIINTPKSKMSYAKAASGGYDDIKVVDENFDMQLSL